jgi:S-adenosylmethionine uptake transporter
MVTFTINNDLYQDVTMSCRCRLLRGLGVTARSSSRRVMGQLWFDLPRDWIIIMLPAPPERSVPTLSISALFHMPIANVSAIMQVLRSALALPVRCSWARLWGGGGCLQFGGLWRRH